MLTFSHCNTPDIFTCGHQVERSSSYSHIDFILSSPAAGNSIKLILITIIDKRVWNIFVHPSLCAFHLNQFQLNFYRSPVLTPIALHTMTWNKSFKKLVFTNNNLNSLPLSRKKWTATLPCLCRDLCIRLEIILYIWYLNYNTTFIWYFVLGAGRNATRPPDHHSSWLSPSCCASAPAGIFLVSCMSLCVSLTSPAGNILWFSCLHVHFRLFSYTILFNRFLFI